MDPVVTAAAAGLAAGVAVAVPLGAVGVLLVSEGMARGWSSAVRAAAGVATVDLLYAGVAAGAGAWVTGALAGRETSVRLVAAAVLAAVAVRGLLVARRSAGAVRVDDVRVDDVRVDGVRVDEPAPAARPALGPYWRFVAVTAVNPMTALYFAALAAGLGHRVAGAPRVAAFAVGVGVGSLGWQCVLAAIGSGAGAVVGPRGRRWTAVAGNLLVLALAVGVAASAVAG